MTSLTNHQSNEFTKLISVGDGMTGKTGSLVSLVKAGYKLRILDLDNKLGVLKSYVLKECPDKANNVEFRPLRDKRKATSEGFVIEGQPKAFVDAVKMLDNWKYKDISGTEIDYGKPSEWGPDCILVIDSLSRLCDSCYDWREPLTPRGKGGEYDGRAVYGDSQDAIESLIAGLTSSNYGTNVIITAHIMYMPIQDGTTKGFPQAVGQKLSARIPQYFPTMIRYINKGGKRTITTESTNLIDLASERPDALAASYPIETGLADIFKVLREPPKTQPKLTAVTRR
jgi:hypothetical protein